MYWKSVFVLVIFIHYGNAYSTKDLMAELEKELEMAQNNKRAVKKVSSSSIDSLEDMKNRLEDLKKDLLKKRGKNDERKASQAKRMEEAMSKLNNEMELASKRQIKKSVVDESYDELLRELKHDNYAMHDEFKEKFYNIIGFKEAKRSETDRNFKRTYLEGSLESILDQIRNVRKGVKKDEVFRSDENGECADKRSDCKSLKDYCETHREKLEGACDYTCGYCRVCKNSGQLSDQSCEALRTESNRNPQGLDYCFEDGYVEQMKAVCYKTCGYCKAPAPPKCYDTKYKCCWDLTTTRFDQAGSNCPACKDAYQYVCKTFKEDCSSRYKPGEFMNDYCPQTCKLCDGTGGCSNERGFDEYCDNWKSMNWCTIQEDRMRHFCSKTCGFC